MVRRVGEGVTEWRVGDRVLGGGVVGAYGEVVAAPAGALQRVPPSMTLAEAATVQLTWPTALSGLTLRGRLAAGDVVVVLGAAGGVGMAAVQCAAALGAGAVIAVVGTASKAAAVAAAGATTVITLADTPDWAEEVRRATGGAGANVIFDPVGWPLAASKCAAWDARYVVVGFAGAGGIPSLALNRVLLKNMAVVGLQWGAYAYNDPAAVPAVWAQLWELYAAGKVRWAAWRHACGAPSVTHAHTRTHTNACARSCGPLCMTATTAWRSCPPPWQTLQRGA